MASVVWVQGKAIITGLSNKWTDMVGEEQDAFVEWVTDQWEDSDIGCPSELRDILLVVSYGSAKERACTYGLVAYLNSRVITKSEVVPSYLLEASSHRAEAGGLLGALEVAVTLQQIGVQFLEVQIVTDNEAAVNTAQKGKVTIGAADSDLFGKLFQLQPKLLVKCDFTWVNGHQDDGVTDLDVPLSIKVRLNIRTDLLVLEQ